MKSDATLSRWGFTRSLFGLIILGSFLSLSMVEIFDEVISHGHFHTEFALLLLVAFAAFVILFLKLELYYSRSRSALQVTKAELEFGMKALLDHSIVSFADSGGNYIDVNENFLGSLGYERGDVIGQSTDFFWDQADKDRLKDEIQRYMRAGSVWTGEHKAYTKFGQKKDYHATIVPLFDTFGRYVKSVCVRTDITTHKSGETDRQLRALLDILQDEVYIYRTSDLKLTYLNEKALKRCEWDKESYRKKSIVDTSSRFCERKFRSHVQPLLTGEKEVVFVNALHEKGHVEISTRLNTGADGEEVFVSVLRDIEARKAIEAAKMDSVSVVSHELRTPLTSIAGSLQLLKGSFGSQIEGKAADLLDIAVRNCDRLLFIINDVLDLQQIESGKANFKRKKIDLVELANDCKDMNEGFASAYGVTIRFDPLSWNAPVTGDSDRLMQVLSNLVSNAVKHSEKDGVVRLHVLNRDSHWRVEVQDNGPGIANESRGRLFESFSQLDALDGKKREGTGLGLAISKLIVKRHNGRIGVDSEVGKGSTFYFELPKGYF